MNPLYRNDRPGQYPPSWYTASSDIPPDRPTLDGDARADLAILGAGYTGLWAALTAARAGLKVIVLEAHRAGFGASGRNGGQVGSGYNRDQRELEAKIQEKFIAYGLKIEQMTEFGKEIRRSTEMMTGITRASDEFLRELERYEVWNDDVYESPLP